MSATRRRPVGHAHREEAARAVESRAARARAAVRLRILGLVGLLVLAAPASAGLATTAGSTAASTAASAGSTTRLAGADRFATAAAASASHFAPGVPAVFVVTGRNFPDALAAGPAAAHAGGPVLLVEPHALPPATAAELDRLRPGRIVVAGGPRSVSDEVVAALRRHTTGAVDRQAGQDRYETAAGVSASSRPSAATVFVASGENFPDALAAVPAAHRAGAPLLLTRRHGLPAVTAEEVRRLGATRAVVLGGPNVVSPEVEDHLRRLVGTVERWAGADRAATSAVIAERAFGSGAPVAFLATGADAADALAAGPVAALRGGPVLLAGANCVPLAVSWRLGALAPQQTVLLGGLRALGRGVEHPHTLCPWPGAPERTPAIEPAPHPAWNDDAPDPHLLRHGGRWYAYTTGTTWGNHLGVLVSDRPDGGWATTTGRAWGSTALPDPPAWQERDTQWAPGVYERPDGMFVLYYAARERTATAGPVRRWCLSAATSPDPAGPFRDRSSGPLYCQPDGSIDPHPFVDADGRAWLHWKSNDEQFDTVSRVWAAPLAADGLRLAGPAREILAKDDRRFPWQTTVDNPQMVLHDGRYYLFHTGGDWHRDDTYTVGYAVCAGPAGPCHTRPTTLVSSYGTVAGPGGGTVARAADGRWWLSYHAWTAGCTSYDCGGLRRLYVTPLTWR